MALAKGKINPLNVVGQRKLSYIPLHFAKMYLSNIDSYQVAKIANWVHQNLNSRYCVKVSQGLDLERRIVDMWELGIEDHKELTMFSLACPYLNNNN